MSKKNPLSPSRHNVLVGAIGGAIVWTVSVFTSGDALSKWGHSFWLIVAVGLVVLGLYFVVKTFMMLAHHQGEKFSDYVPKLLLVGVVIVATFAVFAVVVNWWFGASFRTTSHLSEILPNGNLLAAGGLAGWMYLLLLLAILGSLFFKRNKVDKEGGSGKTERVRKAPRQKREKVFKGLGKREKAPVEPYSPDEAVSILTGTPLQ